MAFKTSNINGSTVTGRDYDVLVSLNQGNYFFPPHGGRAPSDDAVREATQRYIQKKETKK